MPETVAVTVNSQATIAGTFTGTYVSSADNTITVNGLNETIVLGAGTTPPVSKYAVNQKALSTGTGTIDLTALPGLSVDETVTFTGLKLQVLKIRNLSTNANKITVSKGAVNGYQLDGATTWTIALAPGQGALLYLNGAADVVGGGNKTIDLVGTGSQVLEYEMVAG